MPKGKKRTKSKNKLKNKPKSKGETRIKSRLRKGEHTNWRSYTGTLEITRRGTGYVLVPELANDIFIPVDYLAPALNGDYVKVSAKGRGRKIHGRIVKVLKRKQQKFVAKIEVNSKFDVQSYTATVQSGNYNLDLPLFYESSELNGLELEKLALDGAKALVRIDDSAKRVRAVLLKVLDKSHAEELLNTEILLAHGFATEFPENLQAELQTLRDSEDLANPERADYTSFFTCTIDPEDAKDFDDALSVEWLSENLLRIGVHIADVSFFVKPDSLVDAEARARATSVYLPSQVAPMLPEKLSNNICSLVPNKVRLAFAAIFDMELTSAKIRKVQFSRTRILSKKRFTYADAQNIIDTGQGEYAREILALHQIAQKMRQARMQNGSIDFNSVEQRFVLDNNFQPIDIVAKKMGTANQLVEEFMLLANCSVAEYLSKAVSPPFPFRIHDEPDLEKLERFAYFVRKRGYDFPINDLKKLPQNLNKLLQVASAEDRVIFDRLGIRTMAKAVYSAKNIGHYGLGAEFYTHFTSPIRRYPDILTHRALMDALRKTGFSEKMRAEKMESLCEHCSERERAAMDCERSAIRYKQVQWLSKFVGEEMDGMISGVTERGFWVETLPHYCEGMVSIHTLPNAENLVFIAEDFALKQRGSRKIYQMGQRVCVRIVRTDLDTREVDMELVK